MSVDVPMGRDEFFQQATDQFMPDEMAFAIKRGENQDPNRTFSLEAYEAVGYQMHDFLAARTLAYFNRNNVMPRSMRAEMRIVWDEEDTDETLQNLGPPWYHVGGDEGGPGISPADGEFRVSALEFLRERRERYEQGGRKPDDVS